MLNSPSQYLITVVIAGITAILTHWRTRREHNDNVLEKQQNLLNNTHELITAQIHAELGRASLAHSKEREEWYAEEERLRQQIVALAQRVTELEDELRRIRSTVVDNKNYIQAQGEE
jgi:methionyl-tRNA synthetase